MVRIVVAAFGILLAVVMSFDSVDFLSESDPDDGGCNVVVARRSESSMTFAAVDDLSSDEKPAPEPSASLPQYGRQSKKQKREASANRVKSKMTSESSLKSLLLKACRRCKRRCLEKFKGKLKFEELLRFRQEWASLHKTDQDVLLFDSMRVILQDGAEGAPAQWKILGTHVCVTAFKRLHAVGTLTFLIQFSMFFPLVALQSYKLVHFHNFLRSPLPFFWCPLIEEK